MDYLYELTYPIVSVIAIVLSWAAQYLPEEVAQALMVLSMLLASLMPFIIIGVIVLAIAFCIWKRKKNRT